MSDSLWPHELQHARPHCPPPTPRLHRNPCPSSWSCHPTVSSSVAHFFSCPQSLPASGSFPMSQLFVLGSQSIGVSASTSVLPVNTQDWSPLAWTGWVSLQSKGLSRVFSNGRKAKQRDQIFSARCLIRKLAFPNWEKCPSIHPQWAVYRWRSKVLIDVEC